MIASIAAKTSCVLDVHEGFQEGPAQEGLAREGERILEDAKLMLYASSEVEINQGLQFKHFSLLSSRQ